MSQRLTLYDQLKRTLNSYKENNVAAYLNARMNFWSLSHFKVGTSPKQDGAAIFWQVDERWTVHGAKLLLFTPWGTLREHRPLASLEQLNPIFGRAELDRHSCFFGRHLLSPKLEGNNAKAIAIVEDELTAIERNIRDRSRVWLAAGNVEELERAGGFRSLFAAFPYKDFELYHRGEKVETWAGIAAKYRRRARIQLHGGGFP